MSTLDTIKGLQKLVENPLTAREVAAALGTDAEMVNRLVDDGTIPSEWVVRRDAGREGRRKRLFTVEAMLLVALAVNVRGWVTPDFFRDLRGMMTDFTKRPEQEARWRLGPLTVDMPDLSEDLFRRVRELKKSEEIVVEDPDIRGGIPVIKGTRIGVYEIEGLLKGSTMEEVLEQFPGLTTEKIAHAKLYALAHPRPGRPRRRLDARPGAREVKRTTVALKKR